MYVHSLFKADPVKQTEPGHGRTEWKRVRETGDEREERGEGEREPKGERKGNTWGGAQEKDSGKGWTREREIERMEKGSQESCTNVGNDSKDKNNEGVQCFVLFFTF